LTDLTQRKLGVIVLAGFTSSEELVQQVRASLIPIVFSTGADPVRSGLVASMNRAGWQRDRCRFTGGRAVRKATRPSA
jgi:ABC-type uncharacterized transport system substrate-binding protein